MQRQRGSVLINFLVLTLISSVILAGLYSLNKFTQDSSRIRRKKYNFIQLMNNIRSGLEDPHVCYLMLAGQRIAFPTGPINNFEAQNGGLNQNARVDLLQPQAGRPVSTRYVQAGWVSPDQDFEIRSVNLLTLQVKSYQGDVTTAAIVPRMIQFDRPNMAGNPLVSYRARLYIIPKELNGEGASWSLNLSEARCRYRDSNPEYYRAGGNPNSTNCSPGDQGALQASAAVPTNMISDPRLAINFIVNVNPATGEIFACHGEKSVASVCEDAGGSYDATAEHEVFGGGSMVPYPHFRCQPNYRCFLEPRSNVASGVRRTVAPNLPAAAIPPACPWPYTQPDWVGRLAGEDIWVCTWCNNKLWIPGSN